MTTLGESFVNALLADASYVDDLVVGATGAVLSGKVAGRMTPTLAEFIGENFTVVTQVTGLASSFDAVVWRGNANTPYAGQVYVSMRGTQESQDFVEDANLALAGVPAAQVVDMVNWWLRETTPPLTASGEPNYAVQIEGVITGGFAVGTPVIGVGTLSAIGSIKSVNGHSLGGYLATAFARIFGAGWPIEAVNTFNSAGFNRLKSAAIEIYFGQIAQAAGPGLSLGGFTSPQNNYYALNGINVTTNTWNPVGFEQFGVRTGLFQENLSPGVINNHFMYKLTDLLGLGSALEKLDQSLTVTRFNALVGASSNQMIASYEGLLDGVRGLLGGSGVVPTLIGDANSGNLGPQPAERRDFHAKLSELQAGQPFASLAGKVQIVPSGPGLADLARSDFGALAALITLSPAWLIGNGTDDTALANLWRSPVWVGQFELWDADRTMSQADRSSGKQSFTDQWIADRAAFLGALIRYNNVDGTGGVINAQGPARNQIIYLDAASSSTLTVRNSGSQPRQYVKFGDATANVLLGELEGDHLYGGAGNDVINGQGGADYLEGNTGADTVNGGIDADTLIGGTGDDLLEGGTGNDRLFGGAGNDTYFFSTLWGHDIIEDNDGQGTIRAPGFDGGLPIGRKVPNLSGVYRSADGAVTYTRSSDGKTLTIGFDGKSDSIVVRNWQPGQLGIALDEAEPPQEVYDDSAVDPAGTSGSMAVQDAEPSDGTPALVRPVTQLDTSIAIYANDGDDVISSVSRTLYFYVPTAQMQAQVTAQVHRDYIDAGAGNDTVYSGDGGDTILGGAGNDVIFAGLYVPAVYIEGFLSDMPYPNADSYFLPDGTEVVTTFLFNMGMGEADIQALVLRDFDELRRRYDSNIVDGGDGNDAVFSGWGDDVAHGGLGDDALLGQAGDDALFGDEGNDSMYGDSLSAHILHEFVLSNGTPYRRFAPEYTPGELHGRDTLDGGAGDDWLFGMGADDTLLGGVGNDSLFGDTDYTSPLPLNPEFEVHPDYVPSEFHGYDYLDGGDGADQLVGGALDDRLFGAGGNDRMWGDTDKTGLILGLHGDDTLDGGDGDDSLMGGGSSDEIAGGAGNDSIFGDDAESVVAATAHGDDMIDAGDGNDTVFGGGGNDFILGEAGDDQISGDGDTDGTLTGDDWIDGGDGNDLIFGVGGNDWIQGGSGADSLRGGAGADTLEGGAGRDDLSGGTGDDTFRFDLGDSQVDGAGVGEAVRDDGGFDTIVFGAQVDLNSIRVLGDGQALLAIDYSATDRVALAGGLGGTIESFQFANGQSLTWTELVGRTSDTALLGQTSVGTSVGLGGKNNDAIAVVGGLGIVSGGRGNDTLGGSGGANSYHYSVGDGSDVITDVGGTNPSTGAPLPSSTIVFGDGIASSDITLTSESGLVLRVGADAGDRMRIVGFDAGTAGVATNIDRFVFADGTVLDHSQLVSRGFDFDGSAGDDSLQGTSLTDRFAATGGNDTLQGGTGSDTYGWGRDSGQVRIDDADTSATGSIDTLRVQPGLTVQDLALYRVGDDLLIRDRGGSATATVVNHFAGAGVEAMRFDDGTSWDAAQILAHLTNELTEGNDNFTGTSSADVVEAKGGNDTVRGGAGNDLIDGGTGNDSMFGDAGDDSLIGGAGTDTLSGGSGNDTLVDGESMSDEAGNDAYALTSWQGTNIFDFGAAGASTDTLILPVPAADVRVLRGFNSSTQGWDDLVLRSNSQQGDIVVQRYFERVPTDETYKIETIRFADSTVWTVADVFTGDLAIRTTEGNDIGVTGYRWGDLIDGKGGNDGINGQQGDDLLLGGAGDDTVYGAEGSDSIAGGAGADILYGGSGNYVQSGDGGDTLEGGSGSDTLYGGGGNDAYRFGRGSDVDRVEEVAGSDRIVLDAGVGEGDVTLHRNGQDLVVALDGSAVQLTVANHFAGAANQIEAIEFAGGVMWDAAAIASRTVAGAPNSMVGTAGNDTFVVDNAGDTISEAPGQGTDTVQSTVNWTLGANLENLALTGFINTVGYGNALDNVLTGNLGHNDLNGGAGLDTLTGGAGNDILRNNDIVTTSDGQADSLAGGAGDDAYWVSAVDGDLVVEAAGEGVDTVYLRADYYQYALPANVENLIVQTVNYSFGTTLLGNPLDNVITAHRNYSGFVLDGGAGADTLIGADLATTFVVDNVGDVVVARGNDIDTVISSVDWTLDANVENLRLTAGAVRGTGNAFGNKLTGNGLGDTLSGLDGNDTFYGDIGANYNAVGLDSFVGGAGDDQYFIDWTSTSHDAVVEEVGGGNDTVSINGIVRTYSTADFTNIEALILQDASGASGLSGDGADNFLRGNASGNAISGGGGNDNIVDGDSVGGGAADALSGGSGNDTLTSWYGGDQLDGGAGDDLLQWASSAGAGSVLFGWGMGSDVLSATGVNSSRRIVFDAGVQPADLQLARLGADLRVSLGMGVDSLTLIGFFSDATSWMASGSIGTFEFADGSYATAPALAARALAGNSNAASSGNDLLLGSGLADTLAGLDGNDELLGGAGDDDLAGNVGSDSMFGGSGDDTYRLAVGDGVDIVVDSEGTNDRLRLATGIAPADVNVARSGQDLAVSLTSGDGLMVRSFFASSANEIESIQFSDGTVWDNATIKDLAGKIVGSTGADTLMGTSASDRIYGLAGNDSLSGLDGDDLLDGGAGIDTMVGGLGNDTFVVDSTSDVTTEASGQGTDTVQSSITYTLSSTQSVENLVLTGASPINGTGNSLANTITGNSAANALNGGSGADTLIGGAGNDTYTVDNSGDIIVELANEGTDGVTSNMSYTLSSEVENLTLSGSSGLSATGNALDNVLTGNSGANTLNGGAGNDRLDGGSGNDTMVGGTGNDTYVVNATGDVVTELAGEGIDTIEASVTLSTLAANVENLTLMGTSGLTANGNGLDNVLVGNSGANTLVGNAGNDRLDGGAGNDTMRGGVGNDTYVVNSTTDSVTENTGEGTDTIETTVTLSSLAANVENLTLLGTSALTANGNSLANVLTGNSAANTLNGLAGNDTYDGGAGNDALIDNVTTSNDVYRWGLGYGIDTISDAGGTDRVELSAGISAGQVVFARVGNNLELTLSGNSTDKLVVSNWYVGTANRIEDFRLSDGSSVPLGQIPASLLIQRETLSRGEREGDRSASAAGETSMQMASAGGPLGRAPLPQTWWMLSQKGAFDVLPYEPADIATPVESAGTVTPGGWAQQTQLLVSMMASFAAGSDAAGLERQTIQPVHRPDLMYASPAVM